MQVDLSILKSRSTSRQPARRGRRATAPKAAHFENQSHYSPESKSVGVGYSAAYSMQPRRELPQLSPLQEDDSPWRRTSDACGGHYLHPSYSSASLAPSSRGSAISAARPPLNDVLGSVDTKNERQRQVKPPGAGPSSLSLSEARRKRGMPETQPQAGGSDAGAPGRRQPGGVGVGGGSEGGGGFGGGGGAGGGGERLPPRQLGSRRPPQAPESFGIRDFSQEDNTTTASVLPPFHPRPRGNNNRTPPTGEPPPELFGGHQPLMQPPPPPGRPRGGEGAGTMHASAVRRQQHLEEQQHEEAYEKFNRERERRRHGKEQETNATRIRDQQMQAQQQLFDDPNAFDQGLARIYRGRHNGTDAAALLTFVG